MWVSPTELSPAWLKDKCDIACESCTVADLSGHTAPRSCYRLFFVPHRPSLVLKQHSVSDDGKVHPRHDLSLGTAREGLFYKHLAPALGALVPSVVFAEGNLNTGAKCVVMEDLADYVDSGRLFGPTNPHNWDRDLAADEERAGRPPPRHVASVTFRAYAQLHAKYWRDEKLLGMPWLRHAEWACGENRHSWQVSRDFTRAQWEAGKEAGVGRWFDPLVFEAVEKAVNGATWVSLHHGGGVGMGSGAQDLGQYTITSLHPAARRECEEQLLREYHDELVRGGVRDYSFAECWREYTVGGVEKWLWFLCYLVGSPEMADWARAFHNQVRAFMQDHKITAAVIQQLRP